MPAGLWLGLGGGNPLVTNGVITNARLQPPVMRPGPEGGGYARVWPDILKPAIDAGCRLIVWKDPFGNTPALQDDGTLAPRVEWDAGLLAQECPDVTDDTSIAAWVKVAKQAAAYAKDLRQWLYAGNPAWSPTLLKTKRVSGNAAWKTRADASWRFVLDVPRCDLCVDALKEATAAKFPAEVAYLRSVKAQLAKAGRQFIGEEAGGVWSSPDWSDVPGGLTSWSLIESGQRGQVPTGKTGFAFDDKELSGTAMLAMVETCGKLNYTPLCNYAGYVKAKAQGDAAGVN